jgi:hypothetical protein
MNRPVTNQGPYHDDTLDLPEGILACDDIRTEDAVIYSLTGHALIEIDRHRWIESEQHGHDLGHHADEHWMTHCWKGWVRSKLLEHLFGWRRWSAFGPDRFGLLVRGTVERMVSSDLLHQVARILAHGGENLDVIDWALEHDHPLDTVLWLLDRIDINAERQRLLDNHLRLFLAHQHYEA